MAMVTKVMLNMGCTNKLVNSTGNGHDTNIKDGNAQSRWSLRMAMVLHVMASM